MGELCSSLLFWRDVHVHLGLMHFTIVVYWSIKDIPYLEKTETNRVQISVVLQEQ